MRSTLKRVIHRVLRFFGVGIHRIHHRESQAKSIDFSPRPEIGGTPIEFNIQENVNRQYADKERMEAYLDPGRLQFYDKLAEFVVSTGVDCNDRDVVDVGCGTGHFLNALSARFRPRSVTGMDFAEAGLDIARSTLPTATFICHDIYQPLPKRFDVVFCSETLEHLLHPYKALKNLLDAVKRPGAVVLTVPDGRIDTFAGHINFWSPESWEVFVQQVCEPYGAAFECGATKQHLFATIRVI
jgi:SAM-dependent methyltransferase